MTKWTDQRLAGLAFAFGLGVPTSKLASYFKTSKASILMTARAHGLTRTRILRRFTPEEDDLIRARYCAYIPDVDIAAEVNRSIGTVRQRVFKLGLRRSNLVSKLLLDVPPDVRATLTERGEAAFVVAAKAWRRNQKVSAVNDRQHVVAQENSVVAAAIEHIKQDTSMERNQKIRAMRDAGATLEDIGQVFGVTRERIRQITNTKGVVSLLRDGALSTKSIAVIDKRLAKMLAWWEALPVPYRKEFLSAIGARMTGEDLKASLEAP